MITKALKDLNIDLKKSWVIGDKADPISDAEGWRTRFSWERRSRKVRDLESSKKSWFNIVVHFQN
jgi:histidinol phosphatase-like enzyme